MKLEELRKKFTKSGDSAHDMFAAFKHAAFIGGKRVIVFKESQLKSYPTISVGAVRKVAPYVYVNEGCFTRGPFAGNYFSHVNVREITGFRGYLRARALEFTGPMQELILMHLGETLEQAKSKNDNAV